VIRRSSATWRSETTWPHTPKRRAYGRLKEELARRFPTDLEAYMDGKDAFVQKRERRALAWKREAGR
jgi:hypothetical protein